MRRITCWPNTDIGPEFRQAYATFFATGVDTPEFCRHIQQTNSREDGVIEEAKGFAEELRDAGYPELAKGIRDALPTEPRLRTSELDLAKLGNAIGWARQELAKTDHRCQCGQPSGGCCS